MPSAEPRTAPSRLDALDGLRGLAAFGVLILHVWMFSYGDAHRPPKGVLDLAIGELRLGVQLFFVLSGFLLFRPFVAAALGDAKRPRLRRYALRRAARILPAYWAAVLASFLLLRHLDHPMQVTAGQLPIFLLFAQNHFDATIKHLDPPMWTLAIEVSFYAGLPFIGLAATRLARTRARLLALCGALVATGIACTALSALHAWPETVSTSLLLHLTEFGAGMAVAVARHGRPPLTTRTAGTLLATGAALVLANSMWHALTLGPQLTRSVVGDAPGIAGLAVLLAGIVAAPWTIRPLAAGPVRWLGTISFGVYLAHFPVILGLRHTGRWPETFDHQLLAVSAITIAAATASWWLVERPAIRWARRITTTPKPQPAARERRRPAPSVLRPQPAER
jgi:peptidoglycan/LPS O-acetylase OafA/YrhL